MQEKQFKVGDRVAYVGEEVYSKEKKNCLELSHL